MRIERLWIGLLTVACVVGCGGAGEEGNAPAPDAQVQPTTDTQGSTPDASAVVFSLVLSPQPENLLRYDVTVTTDSAQQVRLSWWADGSEGSAAARGECSPSGTTHKLVAWGLKPATRYQLRAATCDDASASETTTLTTGAWPADFPKITLDQACSNCKTQYVLVQAGVTGKIFAMIVDREGTPVWYETANKLEFTYWDATRKQVHVQEDHQTYTIFGIGGTVVQQWRVGVDLANYFHHESLVVDDSVLMLVAKRFPDSNYANYVTDGVERIDLQSGQLSSSWFLSDVYADPTQIGDQTPNSGYWQPYLAEKGEKLIDWAHANALALDKDGNYLISMRQFGENGWQGRVVLVDAKSGALRWSLGKDGDFTLATGNWFKQQHHAHFVTDDTVMLFDNNGETQSRVLQLKLGFVAGLPQSATIVRQINVGARCDSRSGAYLYDSGSPLTDHLLATCAPKATVMEFDSNGSVVWKISLKKNDTEAASGTYRAVPISSLF